MKSNSSTSKQEQWPNDLIANKWAETLSEREQNVVLTRSLKELQARISAALQHREQQIRERCAVIAETSYEQFQTGYNAGKWIAAAIRRDSAQEGEQSNGK